MPSLWGPSTADALGRDWDGPSDPYSRMYGGQGGGDGTATAASAVGGAYYNEGGGGGYAGGYGGGETYGDQSFSSTSAGGGSSHPGSPLQGGGGQQQHAPSVRMGARGAAFLAASEGPYGIGTPTGSAPQARGFVQAFDLHPPGAGGDGGHDYPPVAYPLASVSDPQSHASPSGRRNYFIDGEYNGAYVVGGGEEQEREANTNDAPSTSYGVRYDRGDAQENASLRAAVADLQDRIRGGAVQAASS
jgi:hypothetical protein